MNRYPVQSGKEFHAVGAFETLNERGNASHALPQSGSRFVLKKLICGIQSARDKFDFCFG